MFGNSFNITCQPNCPTTLLTWRRDGAIISNSLSVTVTINGFSVVYRTDSNGMVTSSVLTNNMAMLNDSATYQCTSTEQNIETTNNITIFIYGKQPHYKKPDLAGLVVHKKIIYIYTR